MGEQIELKATGLERYKALSELVKNTQGEAETGGSSAASLTKTQLIPNIFLRRLSEHRTNSSPTWRAF